MSATEWHEMQTDELEQKAKELIEELFNLRLQLAMGVAKNPARLGQARRDLARAKTVLRERALRIRGAAQTT
jgi:large subunit ribosomal protein L29